ncbi:all-trans retinoic acid-induced differentiation factor [Tachyglossus aculeatus]|uniref:all-trans retinoic acid-induced differentiation factor n=1 Tax=Tachyglossus aculeatus TaxID=9261 RepID=UPI0018F357C1|nr:all-trans retinoic acid-induced differentiation factor [Tachyglossus aculeatus]
MAASRVWRALRGLVLLLTLSLGRALDLPEVCSECPGSLQNSSEVARYCDKEPGLELQNRCCLTQQGTIVGLDLQNCALEHLVRHFPQARTAVVLDLQGNPLQELLASSFRGFTQLQTLLLPLSVDCPGGSASWDNITQSGGSQICQRPKNTCGGTMKAAVVCPENSHCAPDGPSLFQCLCADGFHGYKCLRQGSFPVPLFFGILGTATFSISVLLWGTQRRKVKV